LKNLRKEKNLSQETLSNDLNIPRATLASWESGNRNPELSTMISIAEYFNVSIDYLVGRTEIRNLDLIYNAKSKLDIIGAEDTELLEFVEMLFTNNELRTISKQIKALSQDSSLRLQKIIKAIEE
jgi:transcriptional regulator with XRE-family HTH domain